MREKLLNCEKLPECVKLRSGAMVFVEPRATDYVERLVNTGHHSVAHLSGKDVICSSTYKQIIEDLVAQIPRSKTKPKQGGTTLVATDITVGPSATAPDLSQPPGRDVEYVHNTFIEVRHHVAECEKTVVSLPCGGKKDVRHKVEEKRALGVLDFTLERAERCIRENEKLHW